MPQIVTREERRQSVVKRYGPILAVGVILAVVLIVLAIEWAADARHTAVVNQAKVLDGRHDYVAEIKLLDGYIASKPPKKYQYAALAQLGDLTYQIKDYGAAYAWYSAAGTVNAKPSVRDLVGVARSAAAIGDKGAAISSYRDAIKLLPASTPEAEAYADQIRFLGGTP